MSVVLGLTLLSAPAASQQNSLKSQLVGTWTIVATSAAYGPTPKGMLIFDADGHFSFILMRSDLSEYASKNRVQGSAAEYQATVEGASPITAPMRSVAPIWICMSKPALFRI
jgi:hypothetical protein